MPLEIVRRKCNSEGDIVSNCAGRREEEALRCVGFQNMPE